MKTTDQIELTPKRGKKNKQRSIMKKPLKLDMSLMQKE